MKYLIDTCVISEIIKPYPDKGLLEWLKNTQSERLFLSALTIGEIRKGLAKLPSSKRKNHLSEWLNTLIEDYQDRIIPIDLAVAENWGEMQGLSEKKGKSIPTIDGLIASTAKTHNLVLVSRNEDDFENCNVSFLNPWKEKQIKAPF